MGKSVGRRAWELREKLPGSVKRPLDKVICVAAKATKQLRDKKAVERHGKAFTGSLKKRLSRMGPR